MSMTKTNGKTDTQQLAELLKSGTVQGEYAERIGETCPRLSAKNTLALAALIETIVDEKGAGSYPAERRIVPQRAHVPVDWVEYPNGRVGLDSVGNVAEVVLDDPFEVA